MLVSCFFLLFQSFYGSVRRFLECTQECICCGISKPFSRESEDLISADKEVCAPVPLSTMKDLKI